MRFVGIKSYKNHYSQSFPKHSKNIFDHKISSAGTLDHEWRFSAEEMLEGTLASEELLESELAEEKNLRKNLETSMVVFERVRRSSA